ncbi:MAG: CGGC domain-containing protein [Planctomycetota bacterium]|jgi:predicted metal-binding protein
MGTPGLVVTVQCSIVKERCSGYYCLKTFNERDGFFSDYPPEAEIPMLAVECGGCCGKRVMRKLSNLKKQLKKTGVAFPGDVVVHLSSCVSKGNFHSPPCPHVDYIKALLDRHKLTVREGSTLSQAAEKRREEGVYRS